MGVDTIRLAEKPFYGFQGEGPTQGKHSLFIRFSGCNLKCNFCDSKYANEGTEFYDIETDELIKLINKGNHIVFTGGEPLLHQNIIHNLLIHPEYCGSIEIETNGTIAVSKDYKDIYDNPFIQYNISPKGNVIQNSNLDTSIHLFDEGLFNGDFFYKFLLKEDSDIDFIKDFQKKEDLFNYQVYVQPVGIDRKDIYKIVEKYYNVIIDNGWNLSSRLHVLFFGNKRGV